MKRFFILVIVTLSFFVASGCEASEQLHTEEMMPTIVRFRNIEAYYELASMLNETDSVLENYLLEHDYFLDGFHTRKDLQPFVESVNAMPLPDIPGYELNSMNIYRDDGYVIITYHGEGDKRIQLRTRLGAKPLYNETAADTMQIDTTLLFDEAVNSLHQLPSGESSDGEIIYRYLADIQGYTMEFRLHSANQNTALQEIAGFETMSLAEIQ